VLIRGVRYGTLYKLLGSTYTNGCNIYVFLEKTNKEYKTNIIPENILNIAYMVNTIE
jgi:hypothetical protein